MEDLLVEKIYINDLCDAILSANSPEELSEYLTHDLSEIRWLATYQLCLLESI